MWRNGQLSHSVSGNHMAQPQGAEFLFSHLAILRGNEPISHGGLTSMLLYCCYVFSLKSRQWQSRADRYLNLIMNSLLELQRVVELLE